MKAKAKPERLSMRVSREKSRSEATGSVSRNTILAPLWLLGNREIPSCPFPFPVPINLFEYLPAESAVQCLLHLWIAGFL
jgi:hypothetical protein